MATLQHISDTGRVTTITYDEGCGDTYATATMRLGHKTGLWELYDVAKCYNSDYIDTDIRQDEGDARLILQYFPMACQAIVDAIKENEPKHGKGVTISCSNLEADKARGHIEQSFHTIRNDEDGCYHLQSGALRGMKALEALIGDNGYYQKREGIKDKIKRLQEPEQQYRPLGDKEVITHPSLEFRRPLKGGEQ